MSLGTVDTMSLGTVDTVSLGTIDTMSLGTIDTPPDAKSLGTVEGTNDELSAIAGDPTTIDTGCGGATASLLLLLLLFLSETYIDKPTTADINSTAITIRPMGSRSAIARAIGWFVRFFGSMLCQLSVVQGTNWFIENIRKEFIYDFFERSLPCMRQIPRSQFWTQPGIRKK
jgi:hypothetical protein